MLISVFKELQDALWELAVVHDQKQNRSARLHVRNLENVIDIRTPYSFSMQYLWFCFSVSSICLANSNHIFVPRDEYHLHHRQILERSVLIAIYCVFQINLNFLFLQSTGFNSSRLKSLLTFSAPGVLPKQPTKWLDVAYHTASCIMMEV